MSHDQVAIGEDTYETTTLPAYTSMSSRRHDQSEDSHPPAFCEILGVSNSLSNNSPTQWTGLGSTQKEKFLRCCSLGLA